MPPFNPFIETLNPYRVASHKVWEVSPEERQLLLKLDWNEATIPPSPKVKEALLQMVHDDASFSLYPNTHNQELIELLAQYSKVQTNEIQYFASSDAAHEYICKLVLTQHSHVLILAPTYDNFRLTCESQGAHVHYTDYTPHFIRQEALLREAITQHNPALVYLCNPNNPSGTLLEPEFIASLLHDFPQTTFLIDEAYYEFSGITVTHLIPKASNVFISRTFSKAFALAGFRAGYLISQPQNIEKLNRIRNAKNFMSLTQVAVTAALKDIPYMHAYVHEVNQTKEWFSNALQNLNLTVFPSFGNYLLVRFSNETERDAVFQKLAQHDIFVRSLSHHPSVRTCLRITIGTRTQMERVLEVLKS
jgi:histidinol-phosphate aminotransferase